MRDPAIAPTVEFNNTYNQTSAAGLKVSFAALIPGVFPPPPKCSSALLWTTPFAAEMSLDLGTGVTIDVAGVALSQKYIVAVLLGIAICENFTFLSIGSQFLIS